MPVLGDLPDWLTVIGSAIGTIALPVVGWLWWALRREFATKDDVRIALTEIRQSIGDQITARAVQDARLSGRIDLLEQRVAALPVQADLHQIATLLARLDERMVSLQTTLTGLVHQVERHETILADAARDA